MTKSEILARIEELEKENEVYTYQELKINAKQSSIKIFLNTLSYGYLAWSFGAFNDYDEAERITKAGQEVLKSMIEHSEKAGAINLKCDTDGLMLVPPKEYQGSFESEMGFVNFLSDKMPEGINIGHDGRYAGTMIFDKKSYALLEYNGQIKVKGNTLRGRNLEPFNSVLIKKTISYLLENDIQSCIDVYEETKRRLIGRELSADDICKRSSLGMTIEDYINKQQSGNPPIAEYQLALRSENKLDKGDVLKYYVQEKPMEYVLVRNQIVHRKKDVPNYESVEFYENYNYDYDMDHYLERLDSAVKKFMIIGKDNLSKIYKDTVIKNVDRRKFTKNTGTEY